MSTFLKQLAVLALTTVLGGAAASGQSVQLSPNGLLEQQSILLTLVLIFDAEVAIPEEIVTSGEAPQIVLEPIRENDAGDLIIEDPVSLETLQFSGTALEPIDSAEDTNPDEDTLAVRLSNDVVGGRGYDVFRVAVRADLFGGSTDDFAFYIIAIVYGDVDGDADADAADLLAFQQARVADATRADGDPALPENTRSAFDFNGDGMVTAADNPVFASNSYLQNLRPLFERTLAASSDPNSVIRTMRPEFPDEQPTDAM